MEFDSEALIPDSWKASATGTAGFRGWRAFNPTIVDIDGGYAMCYRVVEEGSDVRRLATCRLTPDLEIEPGSVTPLSDHLQFARSSSLDARALSWHADARYLRLRGEVYLLWNDGANRPQNHQFLARMRDDGLLPDGLAREVTAPARRPVEKNWMFFEADGQTWTTYTINPHAVLAVDMDQPETVDCRSRATSGISTDYEDVFGVLRGSAQPLRDGDSFLTLAHSSYKGAGGRTYRACFYRFAATAPFAVEAAPSRPFDLPNPMGATFEFPRLNKEVAEVTYPCGFLRRGDGEYLISYGVNDERCALVTVTRAEIEDALEPVTAPFTVERDVKKQVRRGVAPPGSFAWQPRSAPPVFWWDTAGKMFDGALGNRRFVTGNFGDIAARDIVERITGSRPMKPTRGQRKLLSVGSVLHTANNGDIVWGAGAKGGKLEFLKPVSRLSVHAVRGPLSIEMLRNNGIDISGVTEVFDPGCLVPVLYAKEIAEFQASDPSSPGGIRIVPHYRDDLLMRRLYHRFLPSFVSVDCTPLEMIRSLIGAERVFSSSLHGIIFAESLGIPAYWLAPLGGEDVMKFHDYYYGTERYAIKCFQTLDEALVSDPMPLPKFRFDAYLATFPREAVKAISTRAAGLRPASVLDLATISDEDLREQTFSWNFGHRDGQGLWATAPDASLRTYLQAARGDVVDVIVTLDPFNHMDFRTPQQVDVSINGGPVTAVEWARGCSDRVRVAFTVQATATRTPIEICLHSRNVRSPAALGSQASTGQVAVCVSSVRVSEARGIGSSLPGGD